MFKMLNEMVIDSNAFEVLKEFTQFCFDNNIDSERDLGELLCAIYRQDCEFTGADADICFSLRYL